MVSRVKAIRFTHEVDPALIIGGENCPNVILKRVEANLRESPTEILFVAGCEAWIVDGQQAPSKSSLEIDQLGKFARNLDVGRRPLPTHVKQLRTTGKP